MIRKAVLTFMALLSLASMSAQTVIVKDGKAKGRIVVAHESDENNTAAGLLHRFLGEASGANVPVVSDAKPRKGDIVIGAGSTESLSEDGFRFQTIDGVLYLSSGGDKGAVYGAVTLLEDYLGMIYYTADTYSLDNCSTIVLPKLDKYENPAFRYRQSQSYGLASDPVYRLFLRLEEPRDIFAGGLWVHTFNSIMPAAVYGDEHPEYYSFINGMRRPGRASQWCLTNPEVFELVCERVDSIFKANPGKTMISISQNDSNHTFCQCEECEKVNEYEGAPSGNYIRFLNKLAERFPDKQFSTLAYLFTMKPPKHVKPLPNVNIMLCDIDCKREVPLTENASGREFVEAMKGWASISNNIFLWDYGINFDNYVAPFPNFHILRPNIRLFKDNNVTMHFSQIASSFGGDFAELRTWVVSKLMWNPELNTDELMLKFMKGYYGPAAPYLYRYEKMLEGGLLASGDDLWIYDTPVSHKNGMLNARSRKFYGQIMDDAEKAVENDPVLLRRVRLARLPLMYSNLEIARTEKEKDIEAVKAELDIFEKYIEEFGVPTLNERGNSPLDYCHLYRERYLPKEDKGLAYNADIRWLVEPTGKYARDGKRFLTDGLFGGMSFMDSWTGWEGVDGAFVVDLGDVKTISSVETDFLHQLGQWILLPKSVTYSISENGEDFLPFGHEELPEDQSVAVKFVQVKTKVGEPLKARYVKVEIEGTKICPPWHYGVGYPCWFFIDEVIVR